MTTPVTLHGIPACDTMKKARAWLDRHGVAYAFHDYKTSGIDQATLRVWAGKAGWEALLNRSGTTFRKLAEEEKADLTEERAIALMHAHPSAIRRPVLVMGGTILVGFDPVRYAAALRR
jgi:arsenate reductase